jgi:uncharacterized membrane protein YeaQ/YmgE (transglycosylase-associated protein family)
MMDIIGGILAGLLVGFLCGGLAFLTALTIKQAKLGEISLAILTVVGAIIGFDLGRENAIMHKETDRLVTSRQCSEIAQTMGMYEECYFGSLNDGMTRVPGGFTKFTNRNSKQATEVYIPEVK